MSHRVPCKQHSTSKLSHFMAIGGEELHALRILAAWKSGCARYGCRASTTPSGMWSCIGQWDMAGNQITRQRAQQGSVHTMLPQWSNSSVQQRFGSSACCAQHIPKTDAMVCECNYAHVWWFASPKYMLLAV